jgi:hypothetical protein
MKDALDLRDTQLSEQRQRERGVSLTDAAGRFANRSLVPEKSHEYIFGQLLDPAAPRNKQFSGRRDNRHDQNASDMEVVLHPAARDQPGGPSQ